MKTQSAKAKGRLLQKLIRDKVLEAFPKLEKGDVRSTAMGQSGSDLQLSPAAEKLFPYSVECKNHAKFAGYKFLEQAIEGGDKTPLAVIKANRKQPVVLLYLDDFMELLIRK